MSSNEKTRRLNELGRDIQRVERKADRGRSEIENVVRETKQLYRDVRRVESTANQAAQFAQMMGMAFPAITLLGPYAAIASLVFNVATLVAQQITKMEMERAERERAQEIIELRRELVQETQREIEALRREAFRGVVPG